MLGTVLGKLGSVVIAVGTVGQVLHENGRDGHCGVQAVVVGPKERESMAQGIVESFNAEKGFGFIS